MNLQIARPGEPVSPSEALARGGEVILVPAVEPLPERVAGIGWLVSVDAATPAGGGCEGAGGDQTTIDDALTLAGTRGQRAVACPNSATEETTLDDRVKAAARLPADGVVLDAPDAWYAAGPRKAGFCGSCETRLGEVLAREYAEQFAPTSMLHALAEATDEQQAPFWREHTWLRLRSGIEHGARLTRRIRDEARLQRNKEALVGARLLGVSPAAALLARRLDFALMPASSPDAERAGVAPYEVFRSALSRRPLVALVNDELAASPPLVTQAARLATAAGAEVTLPATAPAESHTALAAHRRFWTEMRTHYRAREPLADVLLLYSPECDHWTGGRHGAGVLAVAEALTRLSVQYRVVLEAPRTGTEPVLLVDAGALPEEDSARIERRIREGAGALLVGACGAADEEGRPVEGPFPDLSLGLNKVGTGIVFVVDQQIAERRWEPLVPALDKGLEAALGRGRRALGSSQAPVMFKAYVDPEKKLDVHIVGRHFDPATGAPAEVKGLTVYLSGSAVSGARSGYLFTPDGQERKVALSPFGMGVQTMLPDFSGAGLLTVSR